MSQNDSTPEVVCNIEERPGGDSVEAALPDETRSILVANYDGYEEIESGLCLSFEGTDESLRAVATFTSNELKCCSFAQYTIAVSHPFETTKLTVTGPEGTKELFEEGLVERLEAEDP